MDGWIDYIYCYTYILQSTAAVVAAIAARMVGARWSFQFHFASILHSSKP